MVENQKLSSIKQLFYLSTTVKIQFQFRSYNGSVLGNAPKIRFKLSIKDFLIVS